MRKTLLQTLLAAFCAILAHTSLEGGGVMLIGMRDAMLSGGKRLSAKSYVQNGLVVHFDGLENSGYGMYKANALTWVNLVGGSNISLRTGWTWENGWARSNYTTAGGVVSFPTITTLTMEFVSQVIAAPANSYMIKQSNNGHVCIYFFTGASYLNFRTRNINTSEGRCATYQAVGNTRYAPHYICGKNDIVEHKTSCYVDGNLNSTGVSFTDQVSGFIIGADAREDWKIAAFRLYNRVLSATEIAANYAVDKARFNLT